MLCFCQFAKVCRTLLPLCAIHQIYYVSVSNCIMNDDGMLIACYVVCGMFLQEQGIELQFCIYNCFTDAAYPWLLICFLYLALLQFIAVILAIQTRKVKIRILNDSKEVAVIIYFTSFVMIVMLAVTFILSDYNNVSDGIFGSSLMISTSTTLIVVFLPKVK